jgi:copper resistance protein D
MTPMPADGDANTFDGSLRRPGNNGMIRGRITRKYGAVALFLGAALLGAAGATAATAAGLPPGLVAPGPLVGWGLPAARVILDVAAVTTVGFSLLPKLLDSNPPARVDAILAAARRVSVPAALLWMLFALLLLVLQVAEVNPGRPVRTSTVFDYVASVPAGLGVLVSAGVALFCAVLGLLAVRYGESVPAELRFVTAMLGLLPLPLTGHATDHDLGAISIELHVLAAATWTGGLMAIVVCVAPRRGLLTDALLADALPRFSRLATLSLIVVGISGAFNGILELVSTPGVGIGGLLGTTYGRIVLVKMICVVLLAALGGHVRFRLMPRIARHHHASVIGWLVAEVTVMGLAYGLGAVLARAPVA